MAGNVVSGGEDQRLTFHTQLQSQVLLHLAEVDPFGNYSSPHYKGTAAFYRVTGGGPAPADDPVCRLSLTLPKVQTKLGFDTKAATLKDDSDTLFAPLEAAGCYPPERGPGEVMRGAR